MLSTMGGSGTSTLEASGGRGLLREPVTEKKLSVVYMFKCAVFNITTTYNHQIFISNVQLHASFFFLGGEVVGDRRLTMGACLLPSR